MVNFVPRTSIHGRRLGISSSGGIISSPAGSSDIDQSAQMWGPGLFESVTASSASIANSGVTIVSTGSTSGTSFTVSAPVQGVEKEIVFQTSATAITLTTSSAELRHS